MQTLDVCAILVPLVLVGLALHLVWPKPDDPKGRARMLRFGVLGAAVVVILWIVAAGHVAQVKLDRANLVEYRAAVAAYNTDVDRYNGELKAYNADPRLAMFKQVPVFPTFQLGRKP